MKIDRIEKFFREDLGTCKGALEQMLHLFQTVGTIKTICFKLELLNYLNCLF